MFTSVAFMPEDAFLLGGTEAGEVKMFNVATGAEESTYHCHDSSVYHMQVTDLGPGRETSIKYSAPWTRL